MVEILSGIVGALAAGAIAKVGDIGGRAVLEAYDALRTLIVSKLGKSGAVQSVEDEPKSSLAQAGLAEALAKAGLAGNLELDQCAKALIAAIKDNKEDDRANIEIGDIYGKVDAVIRNLSASGKIQLGNIRAETGSAYVTDINAGVNSTKKA